MLGNLISSTLTRLFHANLHSCKWALGLYVLALAHDFYLFTTGKSWTYFQYESSLPWLVVGQQRRIAVSASLLFIFLTVSKVLFFQFGLTLELMYESTFGSLALISMLLIAGGIILYQWRGLYVGVTCLITVTAATVYIDKKFSHDMWSASYLTVSFRGKSQPAIPSSNVVYQELMHRAKSGKGSILIAWESLGEPKDKQLLKEFEAKIGSAKLQTAMHEGGSTVSGEIRYLCGLNQSGIGQLASDKPDCIPSRINSSAMHGNTLSYFSRSVLYKTMGFKNYLGRGELSHLPVCRYSYNAVCDDALFDTLIAQVKQNGCKDFTYMLTIDAHFPYLKYKDHVPELLSDVQRFLAKYEAIRDGLGDCQLIIAGDHPPPLSKDFEPNSVLLIRR